MKKIRIATILFSTVFAFGSTSVLLAGCNGQNSGPKVEVIYHLNYNDAGERTVEIPTGTTAVDWNATRDGFKIKDWYVDKACKIKYDFSQKVTSKLNLYADWTVYEGKVPVTFNYNYPGSRSSFTVSVDKYGTVAERYVPTADDVNRLGMELNGWYRDAACTQKWDFSSDTADSETTLYAGYTAKNTIPRDENGEIIYDNVQVNVWLDNNSCRDNTIIKELAEEFNKEYAGKINVNATTELIAQSSFSLRMQSTPQKSVNEDTYYSVSDIYAMADIDYSLDDWYAGAVRDSVYKGALTSVPMFASVPYVMYNKTLMQKYNNGNLPRNYSELSVLLKKAYDGEKSVAGFKSFLTDVTWTFKEGTSAAAFLQNGAEYYYYDSDNAMYMNDWDKEEVQSGAQNALRNVYDLFSEYGACHGGTTDTDKLINSVKDGKSLMCLINYLWDYRPETEDPNIGIMPLSGLFTDNADEASKRIPVSTVGIAFYKASNVSDLQLAAGAVFADYCSKHSEAFTKNCWYPVRKSSCDTAKFDAKYKHVLENVGSPENFYTFSGYNNGKRIVNTICAEKYIVPMLKEEDLDFAQRTAEMTVSLGFEINN